MWYSATINAYDVMGQIHITASVRVAPSAGEQLERLELLASTTVSGTGETNPSRWLEDALVGLLESL